MNISKLIFLGSLFLLVLACGSSDTVSTTTVKDISTTTVKDIEWIKMVGVNKDENNNLKQTANAGWGNAGASSKNSLQEATDGWVEMTVDETNKFTMLGLSEKDIDANYTSIQYAIYSTSSSNIGIFEKGTKIGSFGKYNKGDKLKLQRIGGEIQYIKNDSLLYTSAATTSSALIVDVAMYSTGSTIKDVKSSFE